MTDKTIVQSSGEAATLIWDEQAPLVPVDAPSSFPIFDGRLRFDARAQSERFPGESTPDTFWHCRTESNLTSASLPRIRRGLARAWRFISTSQVDEALGTLEHIERQLDD